MSCEPTGSSAFPRFRNNIALTVSGSMPGRLSRAPPVPPPPPMQSVERSQRHPEAVHP
jgi:hypothetical protein